MYSCLNDEGKAAIISSQGVLFREKKELGIRKKMIEADVIEAIIALPPNLFYGTGIPACILILNKKKPEKRKNNILFIYAAKEFEDLKKRDRLRKQDIQKIVVTCKNFKETERYSHIADIDEIEENDFSLNVPLYVDIFEPEEEINVQNHVDNLKNIDSQRNSLIKKLDSHFKKLGFSVEHDG